MSDLQSHTVRTEDGRIGRVLTEPARDIYGVEWPKGTVYAPIEDDVAIIRGMVVKFPGNVRGR